MPRNEVQQGDFIDITDPDGNPARATLQSFEEVWKERGYKRDTKASASDDKGSQSSK